jgi:hypothetical protein
MHGWAGNSQVRTVGPGDGNPMLVCFIVPHKLILCIRTFDC